MVKITVMVPVEIEVDVTGHGELRFICGTLDNLRTETLPSWEYIRQKLEVISEALVDDYSQTNENGPLAFVGNYAIIQR